jgi:hypothetical protein
VLGKRCEGPTIESEDARIVEMCVAGEEAHCAPSGLTTLDTPPGQELRSRRRRRGRAA